MKESKQAKKRVETSVQEMSDEKLKSQRNADVNLIVLLVIAALTNLTLGLWIQFWIVIPISASILMVFLPPKVQSIQAFNQEIKRRGLG